MPLAPRPLAVLSSLALAAGLLFAAAAPSPGASDVRAFSFERETTVPLSPEEAFDAFTGDVSPWWDHHFSEAPVRFEIEPRPGGGFWEIFDESGDGVLHARVTWAQRGKRLVLRGPLGLHGRAVDLVFDLSFLPTEEGGTRVALTTNGLGAFAPGEEDVIARVWAHFLERYALHARGELGK